MTSVYDWKRLDKTDLGIEDSVAIEHVQWRLESFMDEIQQAEIGWIPSTIATRTPQVELAKKVESSGGHEYITAVKRTHNYGRALLMTQLGLPVVAEMTHSHFDLYG